MDQPTDWLLAHADLLPHRGAALDIACGRGRHALWLAARGLAVTAVDVNAEALASLRRTARATQLDVTTRCDDLEQPDTDLPVSAFDVIVGVHYLHRPLFPAIVAALKPAGILIYETFTRAQRALGKPTNPAFLLDPGELRALASPLEIVDAREGFFEGRHVSSIVARRLQGELPRRGGATIPAG